MRALLAALVVIVVVVGVAAAVERIDVPPRRLAPWVERRAAGHRGIIQRAGHLASSALLALDRDRESFHNPMPIPARTPPDAVTTAERPHIVIVASSSEALHAIRVARPGDVITFIPGRYRFEGAYIDVREPGEPGAPITVRAEKRGNVLLEFDMLEGFLVTAPYWHFENLAIRGVCTDHSGCQHAFHVVGEAEHFVARNNEVVDFNAQFKINGSRGAYPDFGIIDGNVIRNSAVRETSNPVTSIDLVAASHWRIRGNRISDFAKAHGDRVSYGAFVKGGGSDNRLERNVVVCEDRLRSVAGQRVGLSLGGGGTSADACRDGRCITEQERSVIAANLIASCSDDGIYLNRAAMSTIAHNTLIDTAGITARFGQSSADVEGNLVDGIVRAQAGAVLHDNDNRVTGIASLYVGSHPVRRLFADPSTLDLRWRSDPPRRKALQNVPPALCGGARGPRPVYGAFEDIERCAVSAD